MANTSISEKPWSDYTAADYSNEQWHNACLIHQHDGPPTSKSQCKLPIKTPNGTVNRNGVHAAAAALAGARGGVNASAEEKAAARRQLVNAYSKLGEKPPSSMTQSEKVEEFLAHWGIKGMRWGIRRSDEEIARDNGEAADAARARTTQSAIDKAGLSAVSDSDLNQLVNRINLEKRYAEVNPTAAAKGHSFIKSTLKVGATMNDAIRFTQSPAGKLIKAALSPTTQSVGKHRRP